MQISATCAIEIATIPNAGVVRLWYCSVFMVRQDLDISVVTGIASFLCLAAVPEEERPEEERDELVDLSLPSSKRTISIPYILHFPMLILTFSIACRMSARLVIDAYSSKSLFNERPSETQGLKCELRCDLFRDYLPSRFEVEVSDIILPWFYVKFKRS